VYLVGECWKDSGTVSNYYRSGMNFFAFQFHDMNTLPWTVKNGESAGSGKVWSESLLGWERTIKMRNPKAVSAIFLSNHDQGRSYPSFDNDEQRKMAAALYLLSPGTPFIYYGEEIGLTDFSDGEDSDHRGPMWWSNTDQYLTPDPPERRDWPSKAPPSGKGVYEQLDDPASLLRYYVQVGNLKNKYHWLSEAYNMRAVYGDNDAIAAYEVTNPADEKQKLVVAHNTGYRDFSIEVPGQKYVEGFSVWGYPPSIGDGDWVRMPAYSTAIIRKY
jgi:alpha-amylase